MNEEQKSSASDRTLIRTSEVCKMLGVTRNTVHRFRAKFPNFPKPIKDGEARQAPTYFVKAEIEDWIKTRMDQRDAA